MTRRSDQRILVLAVVLTSLLLFLKLTWLLGDTLSLFLSYLATAADFMVLLLLAVKSAKSKRKGLLLFSLFTAVFVALFPLFKVDALKFRLLKSEYEEKALAVYQEVCQREDGIYVELPDCHSWLGKVTYFKEEESILIAFEERYTFFDCYCYVRSFSCRPIAEALGNPPEVKNLGNGWYYVNLF